MKKISPWLILRFGLAFVFLYAGLLSFLQPQNWIGFVPQWVEYVLPRETFLFIHAAGQIVIGLGLAFGIWTRIFAALAALSAISILIFYGIDDITFRDVAILAAAAALFFESKPE